MFAPLLLLLAAAPVTFESGTLTPPLVGAPDQAAQRYATSRALELGLDTRSTLVPHGAFSTRFGGSVHLEQHVNGVRVFGRKVIVTFDTAQRVVRLSSNLAPITAMKLNATLTAQQALALAAAEVEGAWLQSDGTPWGGTRKVLFPVGSELHAGFYAFVPTLKNSQSWHVAVDATDGTVLFAQNRAWAANDAKVYATSPGGLSMGVGVTSTIDAQVEHLVANDGGYLLGDRLRALNCCPTAGCDPDAGPARVQGMTQTFQGPVSFDVAICDQRNRASNDPANHATGNFVYAPVDPPTTAAVSITNLADWDEFAEVHAYWHVSKAYEAIRGLSVGPLARDGGFSPFAMRDTGAGGGLPTVWVNVFDPDFNNAMPNPQGVYVADTLSRTDNAMFLAREDMDQLLLPPQVLNSDALVIYQGEKADFAYDGPVLWHEFGHGVIHSTANWDTVVSFDERSANNESSALHEGIADLFSAMTGKRSIIGEYVGPRIDPTMSAIRNVDNAEKCPDVLWGESHQDSMHFTGAVWEIRKQFLGIDDGATFDAAFYAAVVSFPPNVNFTSAANIIKQSVVAAFPAMSDAGMRIDVIFQNHGVLFCSKTLDITANPGAPRIYYGMVGTTFAGLDMGTSIPGPTQFKVHVPGGAKSVTMSAMMQAFGANSRLELMGKSGTPVTFTRAGTTMTNDATAKVVPTLNQGGVTGTLNLDVPCGGDLYIALGNTGRFDRQLFDLAFQVAPADVCPVVDAGMMEVDAGTMTGPVRLVGVPDPLGPKADGCTCSAVSPLGVFGAALALMLRRRRRS